MAGTVALAQVHHLEGMIGGGLHGLNSGFSDYLVCVNLHIIINGDWHNIFHFIWRQTKFVALIIERWCAQAGKFVRHWSHH